MTKTYRVSAPRRAANALMSSLSRFGLAGRHVYVLTVVGRKSGKAYSCPVTLIEGEERWLVSPYGEVAWVRNARAAGEVQLTRKGHAERLQIEEVSAELAAPILQRYIATIPIVRPYFDVTPSSPITEFIAEAPRHPVFRLSTNA